MRLPPRRRLSLPHFSWLGTALLSLLALAQIAAAPLVYVIPIEDEIEPSLSALVRRGVREAVRLQADYLLLRIDTPGGRTDAMEEIVRAVESFPNQENTASYIDKKAASAGAFIASSTRRIYMAPGSVIGAATPVMIGSGGSPEKLPESYEKKLISFFDATGRATAERHGHNPEVFAAMVNSERGLVVDGATLVPKGRIVTLTNLEAERRYGTPPRNLLSEGTVPTLGELARKLAGPDVRIETLKPTGFETLARFLVRIAPLLLTLGMILGYLEFKAPGTWFFGIAAGLCFLLFFLGSYVAGLSGYEPLILFLLGLVLIAVEIFFLPGFIVPVATGLLLLLLAFVWAMAGQTAGPGQGFPSLHDLRGALLRLAFATIMAGAAVALLTRYVLKSGIATRTLEAATGHGPALPAGSYVALVRVGDTGRTATALRPSGAALFQQEDGPHRIDVVSDGGFLPEGARVRVTRIEGIRVVVQPA
ncbi:membrane-bound serine protease (ClpP class) [Verrucomicrobium sp. GAS474]|uniref:NfeD family protein n=1 Tax=Verrucomicrobium sp. GAS474 TaxID=1882831 RepID=UPI00087CEB90|nr:NfeD family protein [Verrucomicrobium sp. GAS474]SDU04046.1 membrane-bound serine protease (ClpP class) [Verrucomicrobium sp. GAS474]